MVQEASKSTLRVKKTHPSFFKFRHALAVRKNRLTQLERAPQLILIQLPSLKVIFLISTRSYSCSTKLQKFIDVCMVGGKIFREN